MKVFINRIPLREKLFFAEQLAVMLKASISIDRALSSLIEQATNKRFRTILTSLRETVQQGEPLSSGLQKHEHAFGSLFISMVHAGEISGKLDEALRRIYEQIKKDYDLIAKVKSALSYPAFVIVAMIGIGTAIMVYVIPKLIPLFQGFNTQLPLSTRILIAISSFISNYFLWIAVGVALSIALFIKMIHGPLRANWHALLLHLPILSGLIKRVNIARFTRTLSTLLSTDILITDALLITAQVVGNEQYKRAISSAASTVKTGTPLATSLKSMPALFPVTVQTMVSVGEESGTLSDLLKEIAVFYEESVEETTKSISSIIEPALIVLLGAAVGGMALAILMPMYALMQQI